LWVATASGLVRFDGARFVPVPVPKLYPAKATNPRIRGLALAGDDEFWLSFDQGEVLHAASNQTNIFTEAQGLPATKPTSLVLMENRSAWIGYDDGSVCRITGERVRRFTADDGLRTGRSCSLLADAKGRLWFAEAGCVGVFRDGRFETLLSRGPWPVIGADTDGITFCQASQLYHYGEGGQPEKLADLAHEPSVGRSTALLKDQEGAFWVGWAGGGLYRYHKGQALKVELPHSQVLCLLQDREGNIWLGTDGGGLARLRPRLLELRTELASRPLGAANSVCEDAEGNLWAVTQSGHLLRQRQGDWVSPNKKEGWSEDGWATCVVRGPRDSVCVGTLRGRIFQWRHNQFTIVRDRGTERIRTLLADAAGGLWAGLDGSHCERLTPGGWEPLAQPPGSGEIRALAQDSAQTLWLATRNGYLLRSAGNELVDETPCTGSMPRPIRCLQATADGSLWIGYAADGLGRLRSNHFALIRPEHGLHDGDIRALADDGRGSLWFATAGGIFQVPQRELDAVASGRADHLWSLVYGRDEGLPSLQGSFAYWPRALRRQDGSLCFSVTSGLIVAHPDRVAARALPPLPVRLESVRVDGRQQAVRPIGSALRLPAGYRKLEIEFTAPTFVVPESVLFRHCLEGLEDDWTEPDSRRAVAYSCLPPGKYRFRVTACNSAGRWSEAGAAFSLVVEPFVWQTSWFRVGSGISLLAVVAGAVRGHERRKMRRRLQALQRQADLESERSRIAKDIHDELGADLTQIVIAADLNQAEVIDSAQAQRSFSTIAERARKAVGSIDEIVWAVNPRNDNLSSLADYLCQIADDCFGSRPARCRKDVPMGLPQVPLRAEFRHNVTLAVKEALTNALKHSGAHTVWLRFQWAAPELQVIVEDDGAGFAPAAASTRGNGLHNQAARMQELGGSVEVQSARGRGTRVTFRVRLDART
jgi:signal transduction histidine kinase/ligand-binding sensor domain-containing protein